MSAGEAGTSPSGEPAVLGYCVHCRARRQMSGAIQVCNRRGGRDLKGHCSICGKSMYRLGGWDSVAAAAQEAARKQAEQNPPEQAPPPGPAEPDEDAGSAEPPTVS